MSALPGRLVLLGHPVSHSLSPLFQNAALRAAGLPLVYEALDVPPDALAGTLAALVAQGGAGNATVPHKEALFAAAGRTTELAERAGAANTFWMERGVLVVDNTDVGGFDAAIRILLGALPHGADVAVIGAGGAARGVLCAVERWGGCVARLYNRSPARARALSERFPIVRPAASLEAALAGAALVVNATSVGLSGADHPVPVTMLPDAVPVVDLVYRPGETPWVRTARAAGHPAVDGLPMLVEQGALAFERWTGRSPDREAMWAAVR